MLKVLITGSTNGLGLYLAQNLFTKEHLIICGSNDDRLKIALSSIDSNRKVSTFKVDFLDEKSTENFCNTLLSNFGIPDIIVHNVGASLKASFDSNLNEWEKVFRINFLAALQVDKFFLPEMQKNKKGKLIYIGTMATETLDGLEPYVIAKTALDSYVKVMGRKLAGTGVSAVEIRPGPINVPGRYLTELEKNDPESWKLWAHDHSIREQRLLRMDEIACVIDLICSGKVNYLNGSSIDLFGGSY